MVGQLVPVYVLHRRRYRDSSLLLELFTATQGRIAVVSRGALAGRRGRFGLLQPFLPLLADWSGKGEVKTLTRLEAVTAGFSLRGRALYCGFYLNELLIYLTGRQDPSEKLFSAYAEALVGLASEAAQDAVLRRFELQLLAELGYPLELETEYETGDPVQARRNYAYRPEAGLVPVSVSGEGTVRGDTLLALAGNRALNGRQRREARNLLRRILDHYLDGRSLKSRELFYGQGN